MPERQISKVMSLLYSIPTGPTCYVTHARGNRGGNLVRRIGAPIETQAERADTFSYAIEGRRASGMQFVRMQRALHGHVCVCVCVCTYVRKAARCVITRRWRRCVTCSATDARTQHITCAVWPPQVREPQTAANGESRME